MAILGGHFTIMLIVSTPPDVDVAAFTRDLDDARGRLGLGALTLEEVADEHGLTRPEASHIVTVYGADHPGIVHAVSSALAERGVSITGLETKLAGGEGSPIYVMLMELAAGDGDPEELGKELQAIGEREGLDVSLRELAADAL